MQATCILASCFLYVSICFHWFPTWFPSWGFPSIDFQHVRPTDHGAAGVDGHATGCRCWFHGPRPYGQGSLSQVGSGPIWSNMEFISSSIWSISDGSDVLKVLKVSTFLEMWRLLPGAMSFPMVKSRRQGFHRAHHQRQSVGMGDPATKHRGAKAINHRLFMLSHWGQWIVPWIYHDHQSLSIIIIINHYQYDQTLRI